MNPEVEKKYYVVWVGVQPGVYETWEECKQNIHKFKGAKYKSFFSKKAAEEKFNLGYESYFKNKIPIYKPPVKKREIPVSLTPILKSICVDAACSSNPGPVEYRGVDTTSKKVLFHVGPFEGGTNNIGEFLAIVHALSFLKKHNRNDIVYSDSQTAIFWVKAKSVNTTLKENDSNKKIFEILKRAEIWLQNNTYENLVLKWETKVWGEIKADFGRK